MPDELLSRMVSLEAIGVSDPAWRLPDAILLLGALRGSAVAVLGGDVYMQGNVRIEHAYANWYSERLSSETLDQFATRSQRKALEYLTEYAANNGEAFIVGLVMNDEPTAGL